MFPCDIYIPQAEVYNGCIRINGDDCMIYIETGSVSAAWNLAAEYYFTAEKELGQDIFLFWRTEPTIVIGRFQNPREEIDLPATREKGVKIVRRLSGGGTIYSDPSNGMFTFITRSDADGINFTKYLIPVIDALKEMGVDATFNGRNDLVIGGRKCSGNAQYNLAGKTVHHGTLMFDVNVEEMVRLTTVDPQKILSKSIKSVRERVTNVSEHLPEPMEFDEFKRRIVRSVAGEGSEYVMTDEDRARIGEIAREKFGTWESVFGTGPKFSIERSRRFEAGRMTFSLEVEKGCITRCAVSGDFFGDAAPEDFDKALKGCRYRRDDVLAALKRAELDVYRISDEEMADLIVEE